MEAEKKRNDFSKYDSMTTEELIEILKKDFEAIEKSDLDTILYISEEVARRERENGTALPDPKKEWESFINDYHPILNLESTLYEDDEITNEISNLLSSGPKKTTPASNNSSDAKFKKHRLRFQRVIAAIIAIVLIGSISAQAMGFHLWEKLVTWTEDILNISSGNSVSTHDKVIPQQLRDLEKTLFDYGISNEVLPSYLSEECHTINVGSRERETSTVVFCQLEYLSKTILFEYTLFPSIDYTKSYQKDPGDPQIIQIDNTEYRIMSNMGTYYAEWTYENVECLIYGFDSQEELLKIVYSING